MRTLVLTGGALWLSVLFVLGAANFNETKLVEFYSGVKDWSTFSRRYDITRECTENRKLRVTYFTRHAGTLWDFIAVADHLNVSYTIVHPGMIFALTPGRKHSGESDEQLADAKWRGAGQMYCHMGDVLMFGDITADARPLLQGNCTAPIILQVTNRFDIAVEDHHRYDPLMAEVAKRPNVWWIANNPYDKRYLQKRGVEIPSDRIRVLRPVGVSMLPRPAPETYAQRAPYVAFVHHWSRDHLEETFIWPFIKNESLMSHVVVHDGNYGGPAVLAQHKGVIQVPYQVSVMKMYEAMAAGAAFIVPSPDFFVRLLRDLRPEQMSFCCRGLMLDHQPNDWQLYMDWYHPDFLEGMITYDSWEQLKAIIKGEGRYTPKFFESKKRTSRDLMLRQRAMTLAGFDQVYEEARRYACETNGQPDVWSEGMGTHVVGGRARGYK